jgi:hypothetical protein
MINRSIITFSIITPCFISIENPAYNAVHVVIVVTKVSIIYEKHFRSRPFCDKCHYGTIPFLKMKK